MYLYTYTYQVLTATYAHTCSKLKLTMDFEKTLSGLSSY
jgi:hypothetical protein